MSDWRKRATAVDPNAPAPAPAAGSDWRSRAKAETPPEPGALEKTLDYAGRGLGYVDGLARYAINTVDPGIQLRNALIQHFTGSKQEMNPDGDALRTLKGQAPTNSEYMERAGIPEGKSLSDAIPGMYSDTGAGLPLQRHGWADPTVRGVAGGLMDMAQSPTAALSVEAAPIRKAIQSGQLVHPIEQGIQVAERFLNPLGTVIEKTGKKIYASGMKRLDQVAERYGKDPISDMLYNEGVWGRAKSVEGDIDRLKADRLTKRDWAHKTADELGARPDVDRALAPAEALVNQELGFNDPRNVNGIRAYKSFLDEYRDRAAPKAAPVETYGQSSTWEGSPLGGNLDNQSVVPKAESAKGVGPAKNLGSTADEATEASARPRFDAEGEIIDPHVTVRQMSKWASNTGQAVGREGFDTLAQNNLGNRFEKRLGKGFRDEIIRAGNAVDPGSAAEIGQFGRPALGTKVDRLNREFGALETVKKQAYTEAKREANRNSVSSVDGALFGLGNMWALLGKKAADQAKTGLVRTATGLAVGKTAPVTSAVIRGPVANGVRLSPWQALNEKKTEKKEPAKK